MEKEIPSAKVDFRRQVVDHDTPDHEQILPGRSAVDSESHLLVMGAYGHSRIREFIIGSVRTVSVPVLIFC